MAKDLAGLRRGRVWALLLLAAACGPAPARPPTPDAAWLERRLEMVSRQLASRDIDDPRVLEAMRSVPRHRFVPEQWRGLAYSDQALPIAEGQTISQPYIVALMTQLAELEPGERVLEVGTGSGYQAAVLAELGAEVYSIEILEPLARSAAALLEELGYAVEVRHGDGYQGWSEHAPFQAILVTAAPPEIPEPLVEQLAVGGKLVAPVGPAGGAQELVVLSRTADGIERREVAAVAFVPMTGEAQRRRK